MSLFDTLYQKYCLIEEEKQLKTCAVRLVLTNICNMDCWYCPFHSKAKGNSPTSVDDVLWERILEFIKIQDKEYVTFMFTGGEPTAHPKIKEYILQLMDIYKDKINIQVNTNISFDTKYYDNHFPKKTVDMLVSYHTGYVKDPEDFFDKVKFLEQWHNIRVHLMLEKENQEEIKEIYLKYRDSNFSNSYTGIDIVPIHEFQDDPDFKNITWFDKEERHFGHLTNIDTEAKVIPKDGGWLSHRNFKGMLCSGEHIIMGNGNVYHCYQDIYKGIRQKLNLYTDEVTKLSRFKICENDLCNDGFFFPKYSIKHFNEEIYGNKDSNT